MKKVLLEAHQGVASEYPGNTLAAFRAAVEQGYGMIELDTKFTADGRCVILHDPTVNRTARLPDGAPLPEETPIASLTLEEAKRLDFGLAFDERFRGERIPTLEETLRFALDNGIPLKFDNVMQRHTPEQLGSMLDTIERMQALPLVGFTSNDPAFIRRILARFPSAQIHYDGPVSEDTLAALGKLVPAAQLTVWLRFDNERTHWNTTPPVDARLSALARRYGRLGVWLLTEPEELEDAVGRYHAAVVETDGTLNPVK